MNQREKGAYQVLSYPLLYNLVQTIFGASKLRPWFAREILRARKGDRVLDIGCGPADMLRYLPDVDYVGFEPNPAYVEHARKEFGSRAVFHVGYFDSAAAAALEPVDLVLVSGVLHHMTDGEARALFRLLRTVVKLAGRVVSIDPAFVDRQHPLARLFASLDRGKHVRTPDRYLSLAQESFQHVNGTIVHRKFPPYTHWIMTAAAKGT